MHCIENVRTPSYSGPLSVRMLENVGQNNSEYGHFLRSDSYSKIMRFSKDLLSGRYTIHLAEINFHLIDDICWIFSVFLPRFSFYN